MIRIVPLFVGLIILLALMALSTAAYAQGDGGVTAAASVAEPNAISRIAGIAFDTLIPIITALAMWISHRVVKLFEDKTKIAVPDSIENKIDVWISQGILFAEEKSRQAVLGKAEKLTGPEKLELAVSWIHQMAQSRGWLSWSQEMIRSKVEAKIGIHRANGGKPTLDEGERLGG